MVNNVSKVVEHYLSYLTRKAYSNTNLRSWKLSEALKVYLWIIVHNVILIPEIYICKLYTNHTIVIIRNWFFFFFILLVSIIWIRICFCCQKNINSELKGKKQALSQSGGKKKKRIKSNKMPSCTSNQKQGRIWISYTVWSTDCLRTYHSLKNGLKGTQIHLTSDYSKPTGKLWLNKQYRAYTSGIIRMK